MHAAKQSGQWQAGPNQNNVLQGREEFRISPKNMLCR